MTKSLKSKAGTIKKIWINENGHILIQTSELQTIFFLKVEFFHLIRNIKNLIKIEG